MRTHRIDGRAAWDPSHAFAAMAATYALRQRLERIVIRTWARVARRRVAELFDAWGAR